MSDFEKLYDDMLLSVQENKIIDECFMSILQTHNFVVLLKSLYENPEDSDPTWIYFQCLQQGFKMCDLQRALCILKNEWYHGSIYFLRDVDKGDVDGNYCESVVNEPEIRVEESLFNVEYYLRIQLESEEEVLVGEKSRIVIESNFFSVQTIIREAAILFGLRIADDNQVLFDNSSFHNSDLSEKVRIDSSKIEIIREYNSQCINSDDNVLLGDFYYYICNFANDLFEIIEIEHSIIRVRKYIDGLNEFFKMVSIEKLISNKSIVEKCRQSMIFRLEDLLLFKPNNITIHEMLELGDVVQKMDTTMPMDIFGSWIRKLPPRGYYIIKKRYLEERLFTLESVGEICNVTRERIRQVEQKAIRILLDPKRNRYRSALVAQLKLLSPHKSFITIKELNDLGLNANVAIFLDKITGDIIYERAYKACFFSRDSKDKLEFCLEELPSEFTKTDLKEYSNLISEQINGAFTTEEICDLICNRYKIYGEYIAKSRLTLKVVLSFLMQKYFPNGMDIYKDENIDFLRQKAIEEFDGFELAENNRAVRARLQDFGALVARGVWKYDTNQILIHEELRDSIIEYIEEYNSPVLPIQAILDKFIGQLSEIEIHNKYSLHGQLKKILPTDYSINRDYILKSDGGSIYDVVEAFVKQAVLPVTKRDILDNFPGITDVVIQQIAAATKIINMNGYYVHLDNLNITDEEIDSLKSLVDNELKDGRIHHANMVFAAIKGKLSGLFVRIGVTHYLQFYYLLQELFLTNYEYYRPFIAILGVKVVGGEAQVINLILQHEECSIATIRQYAREVGTVIDRYIEFVDRNNDSFIFKNRNCIITTTAVGLDEKDFSGLDKLLINFMGNEQYRLLSDFYNYRELPDLSCAWNTWLLYSVIKKYSKEFKLVLTSNYLSEAKPILVRITYDEHNIDLDAISKLDMGDTEQFSDSDEDMLDSFDYDDLE